MNLTRRSLNNSFVESNEQADQFAAMVAVSCILPIDPSSPNHDARGRRRRAWPGSSRRNASSSPTLGGVDEPSEFGRAEVDPDVLYHSMIGAASLLYANGPEAELLGIKHRHDLTTERRYCCAVSSGPEQDFDGLPLGISTQSRAH